MYGNIAPHIAGQAASSLDELAARVCKAQAGFVPAASSAVLHAIEAGQALIAAKKPAQASRSSWCTVAHPAKSTSSNSVETRNIPHPPRSPFRLVPGG